MPDEAWWDDDFYTPRQRRIEELHGKYVGEPEALSALAKVAQEREMGANPGSPPRNEPPRSSPEGDKVVVPSPQSGA